MTSPQIHGRYRTIPASLMLETLGKSLSDIKARDSATDGDLGAVLGKSDDRAAAYRAGAADMGLVSFVRGCREWDGCFANGVLGLVGMKLVPIEAEAIDDQASITTMLSMAMALSAELEKDGDVSDDDLERHRFVIERAAHVIDGYRERLRSKAMKQSG
uniref:hypothetical protein n=1 Tax=uncultured Sphingomonas sp. TaxID=158754 RepID=UPI0035CC038F